MGAYGLLEACGGIKTLATSARVDAQIGILTWYMKTTFQMSLDFQLTCQVGCYNKSAI